VIRYAGLVYAALAWLFVAVIVIQVFLIGLALFSDDSYRQTHIEFGYTGVGLAALALLISALIARPGRRQVGVAALLFVLYIVQTSLPEVRTTYPAVAALHPVNALVLFGVGVYLARAATGLARRPAPEPQAESASQPGAPT
jgi:hypothetical protein